MIPNCNSLLNILVRVAQTSYLIWLVEEKKKSCVVGAFCLDMRVIFAVLNQIYFSLHGRRLRGGNAHYHTTQLNSL